MTLDCESTALNMYYYDWNPPLPELISNHKLKSIDLEPDLAQLSNPELVQYFVKISANNGLRDTFGDLSMLTAELERRVQFFSFEDLVECVKGLTAWPEAPR